MTPERFEDFADVINENRRPTHCWCLSHRLTLKEVEELGGTAQPLARRPSGRYASASYSRGLMRTARSSSSVRRRIVVPSQRRNR